MVGGPELGNRQDRETRSGNDELGQLQDYRGWGDNRLDGSGDQACVGQPEGEQTEKSEPEAVPAGPEHAKARGT
jgi:hypothetical protein